MSFNLDLMQVPGLVEIFARAIKDGREWGKQFVNDSRWQANRDRMSDHAIYESTMWSVTTGIVTGAVGFAGIPIDAVDALYSQVKLSSALFTIHGFDTSEESIWVIVIAAAAGVSLTELATHLGTHAAIKAIQKALLPKPFRMLMKVNQSLTIKLVSKLAGKNVAKTLKVLPAIGGVIGGSFNAIMMNVCGHGVLKVIKAM